MVSFKLRELSILTYLAILIGAMYLLPHPLVPIALGLCPLLIWGVVHYSFYVVIGFVVFSFFRIHEVFPQIEPFKFPLLLALGSLFVISLRLIITKTIRPYWCKQFTYLISFFLLVTVAIPFSANVGVASSSWSGVYSKIILMTFVIAWMMREEAHFVSACRIFLAAGACVGVVALLNKANGIGLVEGTRVTIGRDIGSLLGDPNDLALVLLYPMAYAIASFMERELSSVERLLSFIVFIILFFALLATQSRGGLLGFIAVTGLFAINRIRSKLILFGGGAVALMVLFIAAGISDRSSGGAAEEGIDESAMGRLYAWEAAWNMALDNPLMGVGINNFFYNYFFYSTHWDGLNHAVHSTWFGVLAEAGFLGLFLFVAIIVSTFITSWKLLKQTDLTKLTPGIRIAVNAAPAGIIGFVASGTFLTQGFLWPIYLQVALVIALQRFIANQNEIKTNAYRGH